MMKMPAMMTVQVMIVSERALLTDVGCTINITVGLLSIKLHVVIAAIVHIYALKLFVVLSHFSTNKHTLVKSMQ
jgi:hypothetical protein